MKILAISALAAMTIASFTTFSQAECSNQTGPKGNYDNCSRRPHYGSDDHKTDKVLLQRLEGISRNDVLRPTGA